MALNLDDYTDEELVEDLLLRGSDADEHTSSAMVAATIEAAGGDEQAALQVLEARRAQLVETALAALQPLKADSTVIFAHDELDEKLNPES